MGASRRCPSGLSPALSHTPLAADWPLLPCAELLAKYASEAQKSQYLGPMLQGKIRSAFAMTEKGGA